MRPCRRRGSARRARREINPSAHARQSLRTSTEGVVSERGGWKIGRRRRRRDLAASLDYAIVSEQWQQRQTHENGGFVLWRRSDDTAGPGLLARD
jgi:hypothetical protein